MDDKKDSMDDKKESMDDKKESMGDKNFHNSNRVEAGGAQGGNFVDSQVHNNTFHIHSQGRKEFSLNYQKLKVIGRGSFGDVWKVKPKLVTVSEEFVMKEIRCCDQEIDDGKKEVELLMLLGCILYELASLQPAFSGHTFLLSIMQVLL